MNKLIHITKWRPDFERVPDVPGALIARPRYIPVPKEWAKLMVCHWLRLLDAAVFICSMGILSSELSSTWLFSEVWEDE